MNDLRLRMPMPRCVVMLALPNALQGVLRSALRDHLVVLEAGSVRECARVLAQQIGASVLLKVPTPKEETSATHLWEFRQQFPNTPVVALFENGASGSHWAFQHFQSGAIELVTYDVTPPAQLLLEALSRGEADTIAVRVWKHASLQVGDALAAVLKPAIRLAHAPITLPRLAASTRMHERSLRKYCEQHGLPSPQWIIGWARLLLAAYYLEEPGRSVQSVVDLLQFPSVRAFANSARRYASVSSSQLKHAGSVSAVSQLLVQALEPVARRSSSLDAEGSRSRG